MVQTSSLPLHGPVAAGCSTKEMCLGPHHLTSCNIISSSTPKLMQIDTPRKVALGVIIPPLLRLPLGGNMYICIGCRAHDFTTTKANVLLQTALKYFKKLQCSGRQPRITVQVEA